MRNKPYDMKTRAEFDAGLEEAIELTRKLKRERKAEYYSGIFPSAELQLYAIKYWMREGREPSFEQRSHIDIQIQLVRCFDTVRMDPELEWFRTHVGEVASYYLYLPPEGRFFADLTLEERAPARYATSRARKRLKTMDSAEMRRVLELDDIPFPDDAGFPKAAKT